MNIQLPKIYGYDELTSAEKAKICNGMGAKGSFLSRFIPNTMWGLEVVEAGNRHDYRYEVGETEEEKRIADVGLITDLAIIISNVGGLLLIPRMFRAMTYYFAVHYFGHDAFFKNKSSL